MGWKTQERGLFEDPMQSEQNRSQGGNYRNNSTGKKKKGLANRGTNRAGSNMNCKGPIVAYKSILKRAATVQLHPAAATTGEFQHRPARSFNFPREMIHVDLEAKS